MWSGELLKALLGWTEVQPPLMMGFGVGDWKPPLLEGGQCGGLSLSSLPFGSCIGSAMGGPFSSGLSFAERGSHVGGEWLMVAN